jgi:hypothetical protein
MYRRGGLVLVKRTARYELPGKDGPTVLGVETPKTLFRRGILHSSVVAHVMAQKFSLGVPHYRLEQHLAGQGVELDRGLMCRYVEEAGSTCGATIVHAMWQDALQSASVISRSSSARHLPSSRLKIFASRCAMSGLRDRPQHAPALTSRRGTARRYVQSGARITIAFAEGNSARAIDSIAARALATSPAGFPSSTTETVVTPLTVRNVTCEPTPNRV